MGLTARWLLCTLAMASAGCSTDSSPPPPDEDGETASKTRVTTPLAEDVGIMLDGALTRLRDGWAVNVSAFNAHETTFGHSRYPFDHPYQPAWNARLSGAPGEDLDYTRPGQYETSYAMYTNQPMPPSSYVNWTYSESTVATCHHRPTCTNTWDGNLTLDGQRVPAPAGTYTWRFTFTYSLGQSPSPSDRVSQHIDFQVEIGAAT